MRKNWRNGLDLRVYLVTDRDLSLGRPLLDVVLSAVRGGATIVQLREKKADAREFLALAKALVAELHPRGVPVIINDRADIALASGAAGLHVGQSDLPAAEARAILGAGAILGLSLESMGDLEAARHEDLDYLAASPVYATPTKTDTAPGWGLEGLAALKAAAHLPVVAIGGIHQDNAVSIIRAGADGLAVVSEICSAPDPGLAAGNLLKKFSDAAASLAPGPLFR